MLKQCKIKDFDKITHPYGPGPGGKKWWILLLYDVQMSPHSDFKNRSINITVDTIFPLKGIGYEFWSGCQVAKYP